MKKICAIFCLNEESRKKIQSYRDELTLNYGMVERKLYPHITIAHYLSIDVDKIVKYSEKFIEGVHTFNISYNSIEVLGGNCVACIADSDGKIGELYNRYHAEFDSNCDLWTKKENSLWVPHSTLYGNSEERLEEMKIHLEKRFIPFKAKVIRFELSQIEEDGFKIIFSKDLQKNCYGSK